MMQPSKQNPFNICMTTRRKNFPRVLEPSWFRIFNPVSFEMVVLKAAYPWKEVMPGRKQQITCSCLCTLQNPIF